MTMKSQQTKEYHYAIDAAQLILKARANLHQIIYPPRDEECSDTKDSGENHHDEEHCASSSNSMADDVNPNVLDLDRTLLSVEQLIHYYLLTLVQQAKAMDSEYTTTCTSTLSRDHDFVDIHYDNAIHPPQMLHPVQLSTTTTLASTVDELTRVSAFNHNRQRGSSPSLSAINAQTAFPVGKKRRSQSLSFPLRNKRIDPDPPSLLPRSSSSYDISPTSSFDILSPSPSFQEKSAIDSLLFRLIVILQLCLVRIEEAKSIIQNRSQLPWIIISTAGITALASSSAMMSSRYKRVCNNLGKQLGLVGTFMVLRKGWRRLCLNTRLLNTSLALEDWQQQWVLIQSCGLGEKMQDEQCRHLLTLIPSHNSYGVWGTESTFRYNLIKWLMDCVYASVGTAIDITKPSDTNKKRSIWMPIAAAAAAGYYALVGPESKSAAVLSSKTGPESSDLIQNTWGMVSLPVVKTLSLQASRLLKGAAIAERINICGVSCFILSKDPCPALSTAIKRYRRQQRRDTCSSHLGTILEEQLPSRTVNLGEYPRKDIIFHLTGGGFFAHTLAGDIPFLMDWSGVTKSVVIAIEYALLPDHKFPVAINEVTKVFTSIVNGDVAPLIGLQTGRIIVTGESTGGNLATSLCIKLCKDGLVDVEKLRKENKKSSPKDYDSSKTNEQRQPQKAIVRLPDALLLCCPALNLSLKLSPSRIVTHDAVLPTALISTISNAYLENHSKTDPLASPVYAPDSILSIFPPTLMYVSSEDPFLDDSVVFNKRLKRLGVECDLRAARNLPHAYWGLGTAGFPEAKQVQRECEAWMTKQFNAGRDKKCQILVGGHG